MRIVSLLPSLTELVCALGRGEELVGVTHECDYPPGVEALPHLTRSLIDPAATSAGIDAAVATQGGSLYELDGDLLAALAPDLVLTQSQCDVCAVNEDAVRAAAALLGGGVRVESVNPLDLAGIYGMFRQVGALLDRSDRAEELILGFEALALEIDRRREGAPAPRVAMIEWVDPIYGSGHWNPDLIALAGGREVLGAGGKPARRLTWAEVLEAEPEVLIVGPCGYSLERAEADLEILRGHAGWDGLPAVRRGMVTVVDGSSYFSRPGPRLVDSLAIAAAAIDPDRCADLAPRSGWKRLFLTA
jgi:iron complex transport system substrate-binding protein